MDKASRFEGVSWSLDGFPVPRYISMGSRRPSLVLNGVPVWCREFEISPACADCANYRLTYVTRDEAIHEAYIKSAYICINKRTHRWRFVIESEQLDKAILQHEKIGESRHANPY